MIKAHEWYETPKPSGVLRKRQPECGHQRFIVHKDKKLAWCWDCQGPVNMVKIKKHQD